MTFLHLQLALAGFACIGIPILIHLLMRRRRKPIMWGAMRFLLEAYRRQRRRLMIERLLLLLTRCLLVAAIAAAIARPLLGELLARSGGRTLYILIDNSLASQAVGDDGRAAIERHQQTARELLEALATAGGGGNDRAAIIAIGAPPEGVVLPASADLASVRGVLESMSATESRADLPGAISSVTAAIESDRINAASGGRGPVYAVILSDFLAGSADADAAISKLPADVRLVAGTPADARANLSIVGVEPERSVVVTGSTGSAGGATPATPPAQTGEQVRVLMRRSGGSAAIAETTSFAVRMLSEDASASAPSRGQVRWSPGQETATGVVQLQTMSGARRTATGVSVLQATIERTASAARQSNAIPGDDTWRRPVPVRESLRVGVVSPRRFGDAEGADRLDAADWARLALRPGDSAGIDLVDVDPASIDGARLAGLDAVVLARPDLVPDTGWQRLRLFVEGGGLLMVFPAPVAGAQLWTDAMTRELGLDVKFAREPKVYGSPEKGDAPMSIGASAVVVPPSASRTGPEADRTDHGLGGAARDLLALIRGELDELARPVSVWQTLPIERDAGGRGTAVLSLADGSAFVWASSLVSERSGSGGVDDPARADRSAPGAAERPEGGTATTGAGRGVGDARATAGLVVYFAAALDLRWTDLPAKPLIVPLVQEVVREGVGQAHGSWSLLAGSTPVLPARTAELRLDRRVLTGSTEAMDTEHQGLVPVAESGAASLPLRRASLWRALDDRGAVRAVLAVNPDPRGGLTDAGEAVALSRWLASVAADGKVQWLNAEESASPTSGVGVPAEASAVRPGSVFTNAGRGRDFSLAMLVLALCLGVLELALARWSSHASVIEADTPRAGAGARRVAIGGVA